MNALDKPPSHIEHMIAFAELRGSLAGDDARAELAQLRADLAQAQACIAELTAERDAARAELASNKVYQRMAAQR